MNNFIKNNEGFLGIILGLILISYDYFKNDFRFDGYPMGAIILLVGIYFVIRKYFFKYFSNHLE